MNVRIARFGFAVAVLAIVGIVLLVASEGTAIRALGVMLLGLGLVLAVAAVFLEVGLSEEREREREGEEPPPRSPET